MQRSTVKLFTLTALILFSLTILIPLEVGAVPWSMLQGTEDMVKKRFKKKAPYITIWGFLQPIYAWQQSGPYAPLKGKGTSGRNSFVIQRARLGARGSLSDRVDYFFLYEFGDNGITRRRSDQTTGAATASFGAVTDASVTIKIIDPIRIRVGQFKLPFGLEGLEGIFTLLYVNFSEMSAQMTLRPNRNFTTNTGATIDSGATLIQAYRDIGVQIFGGIKAGPGKIFYAIGVFNGAGILRQDDNNKKDIIGTVHYDFKLGKTVKGSVGISGAYGKHTIFNSPYRRYGAFTQWDFLSNRLHFRAETIFGNDTTATQANYKDWGWFTAIGFDIIMPKKLRVALRYDEFYQDKAVTAGSFSASDPKFKRLTLALHYFLKGWSRFTFNYEQRFADQLSANSTKGFYRNKDKAFYFQFTYVFSTLAGI